MQAPTVITMVKLKNYYIPYDGHTMSILRSHGIFNTRIKDDLFETIAKLRLKPNGVRGSVKPFSKVDTPFWDKLITAWRNLPDSKVTRRNGSITLSTLKPESFARAKLAAQKVEQLVSNHFSRWGSQGLVNVTERNQLIKITITYTTGSRDPVIPISKSSVQKPKEAPVIDFGNCRIRVVPDESGVPGHSHRCIVIMEHKTGDTYKISQTCTALYGDFSVNPEFISLAIRSIK